jgi:DNA-binding SARP family transcriptional activator/Flp pilus assembly protein TadD
MSEMLYSKSGKEKNRENTLELACNKITIREANLILEQTRCEGDSEKICASLIQLAHLHFRQGHYTQTKHFVEEVLRDALPVSPWRCDALRILGNCAAELGDPSSAEAYYHQAIDLARQIDYRYALFKCLHSLATNIYWAYGQFDLCLAAGKEALAQAQALELSEELWFPLSDIAWSYWNTGQRELALQIADQMQSLVSPGSLGDGFTCCLCAGLIEPSGEYLSQVHSFFKRARSIAEATGDPGLNIEVRIGLCRSYRLIQDYSTSLHWAEDAVKVCERLNYCQFKAIVLIERGRTLIALDNYARAEKDIRTALDLSVQQNAKFDETRATLYLAVLLSATNKSQADDFWIKTIHLIKEHGYDFLVDQERTLLLPWVAKMLTKNDPSMTHTSTLLFNQITELPPPPLHVRTLGQYTLQIGPHSVKKDRLRKRRAGELLALLLSSHAYSLSAEQVCEAMCAEKDPCAAVDFYHHAISALRRLLEPDLPDRRFPSRYLEVSGEQVTLIIPPSSSIDFLVFELHVQEKAWEQAIAIYQGEFLPVYRYMEWSLSRRQQLADQFELSLLAFATQQLSDGNAVGCLDLVQRALVHSPWQEQAVKLGMRAALSMGNRVTAIKLYQRLEKHLEQELGIAPEDELQQLYLEIKKRRS